MHYHGHPGLQSTKLLDQSHFVVIGHILCHLTIIDWLPCVKHVVNLISPEYNVDKTQLPLLIRNVPEE